MSDWVEPPVIENALIVFISETMEESGEESRALQAFILEVSAWCSLYLFTNPDEDGELPLWMETSLDGVALAAHTTGEVVDQIHQAVRRITSRAETTRVVVLPDFNHSPSAPTVRNLIERLEKQSSVIQWEEADKLPAAVGWVKPDHAALYGLPWKSRTEMVKLFEGN